MPGGAGTEASTSWQYTERDVILYALSVGCSWEESRYVYENSGGFLALPTFGVLPLHNGALNALDFTDLVPNFNPMLLLHGEQYLELSRPFPTSGEVTTTSRVIDVLDKGKAALLVLGMTTADAASGEVVAENETTVYIRGSGGFGKSEPKPRKAAAIALHTIPAREADTVMEEQTKPDQAALYRLNGDENPLHIDSEFAAIGGFPRPILHGLCTFGVSGKHLIKAFARGDPASLKSIKGRFAKHVFPGETLRTEMWQTADDTVVFQTKVVERGVVAISNAAVVFRPGVLAKPSRM